MSATVLEHVSQQSPEITIGANIPLVTRSRHNLVLRLRVGKRQPGLDELLSDLGLGDLDLLARKLAHLHHTLVEALLVSKLLGLLELLGVLGRRNLELLNEIRGQQIRRWRLNDGDDLQLGPLL